MKSILLHIVFWIFLLPASVNGQFLNIQIDVEPEVDTRVEQSLDFGEIMTGEGLQQIQLGSPNMGIFHIRALRTQRLLVSLDADTELTHESSSINATVPIQLYANYTNDGVDNYLNSEEMGSTLETIVVEAPPHSPESVWSSMYLYIYGDIDMGNVPTGVYRGEVVLTVIYE